MPIATIDEKQQVNLPKEILTFFNLHAGDKVAFIIQDEQTAIIKPLIANITELKGLLPKPKKSVSLEKMNAAIRKNHMKNKY